MLTSTMILIKCTVRMVTVSSSILEMSHSEFGSKEKVQGNTHLSNANVLYDET